MKSNLNNSIILQSLTIKFNPNIQLPFWLVKLKRFEFWPFWVLYLPIFVYYFWLSLKSRSLVFFSAANPSIFLGGMLGESKSAILQNIPDQFLPKTRYYPILHEVLKSVENVEADQFNYPFIIKPDRGERGDGVELIYDRLALIEYLTLNQKAFIVQEYIDYPIELGVLYYRFPDGSKSGITSITGKEFLTITGDGKSTIHELLQKTERAQLRFDYLVQKFQDNLVEVVPFGESRLIEPIGNHCRGTAFVNLNQLINPELVKVFDTIAQQINGFYIGRFDLKVPSIADLREGKNIKIMELNGVSSEPAHIYDPNENLLNAYQALFQHYELIYNISKQNRALGTPYGSFSTMVKELFKHYSNS